MRTSQVESKVSPCFTCGNTTYRMQMAMPGSTGAVVSQVVSQVRTAEQSSLRESSSMVAMVGKIILKVTFPFRGQKNVVLHLVKTIKYFVSSIYIKIYFADCKNTVRSPVTFCSPSNSQSTSNRGMLWPRKGHD